MCKKTGFTLVELIIVVAIISILASIILPNMKQARSRSSLKACDTNLRHLAIVMEIYANENLGIYRPVGSGNNYLPIDTNLYLVTGGYLKTVPHCNSNANTGEYAFYRLYSPSPYKTYMVYCPAPGTPNHSDMGLGASYPRYYSDIGLVER